VTAAKYRNRAILITTNPIPSEPLTSTCTFIAPRCPQLWSRRSAGSFAHVDVPVCSALRGCCLMHQRVSLPASRRPDTLRKRLRFTGMLSGWSVISQKATCR
jgi:hypothetical protein